MVKSRRLGRRKQGIHTEFSREVFGRPISDDGLGVSDAEPSGSAGVSTGLQVSNGEEQSVGALHPVCQYIENGFS